MSGIEIAGLVLGAIPLVVTGEQPPLCPVPALRAKNMLLRTTWSFKQESGRSESGGACREARVPKQCVS